MKQLQKGFTLIELLVVIAVIGVLAGLVLIAINPQEQMDRARDAKKKQELSAVANAVQAYYTASGSTGTPYYPKVASANSTTNPTLDSFIGSAGSGDLKNTPESATYVGDATTGGSAMVYVQLASARERQTAVAGQTANPQVSYNCASYTGTTIYMLWSSVKGKIYYKCAAVPALNDTLP